MPTSSHADGDSMPLISCQLVRLLIAEASGILLCAHSDPYLYHRKERDTVSQLPTHEAVGSILLPRPKSQARTVPVRRSFDPLGLSKPRR
jgi:hypothetical protein